MRALINLLGLLGVLLLFSACNSWQKTYDPDSSFAYGTDLLPAILQAHFGEDSYTELARRWKPEDLAQYKAEEALYLAVAPGLLYTQAEADSLLSFAYKGARVLVACEELSHRLLEPLTPDTCFVGQDLSRYFQADSAQTVISATGKRVEWPILTQLEGWSLYPKVIHRDMNCLPEAKDLLGTVKQGQFSTDSLEILPWMIRIPHGKGSIDYLSVPMMLTNVYATDSLGWQGIQAILDFYPNRLSTVLFDRDRRNSQRRVAYENYPVINFDGAQQTGDVLEHLLSQPPFALAWYSLILGFVAFLVFGAKRRQRIVPLIQTRKNSTHEHLEKISRLYLANPNNALMSAKQLSMFEAYCGRRFGLAPLRNPEDLEKMKRMPGVNPDFLDSLTRYQHTINRKQPVSPGGLVQLVRILQHMYKSLGRKIN